MLFSSKDNSCSNSRRRAAFASDDIERTPRIAVATVLHMPRVPRITFMQVASTWTIPFNRRSMNGTAVQVDIPWNTIGRIRVSHSVRPRCTVIRRMPLKHMRARASPYRFTTSFVTQSRAARTRPVGADRTPRYTYDPWTTRTCSPPIRMSGGFNLCVVLDFRHACTTMTSVFPADRLIRRPCSSEKLCTVRTSACMALTLRVMMRMSSANAIMGIARWSTWATSFKSPGVDRHCVSMTRASGSR